MNRREPVIRRKIRAWRMPSTDSRTARRWGLPGLILLAVVAVVTLNSIGAEAVPLAFQSPFGTPTPTPSPTPTFDPLLFPTVTPTFDPNLFPTVTPTAEMMLPPEAIPTAAIPLPPTDSLSSVLESPPQGAPAAPEVLPLLPKPEPGTVPLTAPKTANPADEARLFGKTVMAALTYVWLGCGVMLLLLAGMGLLWLNRRGRSR